MNKTELVAAMAEKAELSKKDAEKALKAFEDVVTEELTKNGKVQLVGFGTFDVAERAAKSPKDSLNWQKEVANILTGGHKATNGQMGRAAGMIRTATGQALNRTRLEKLKSDKVKKYKFISLEAPNTCKDCADLDGNIYDVKDAKEGVNFPLMHYNRQCTVIEANDKNDWDTSDHDVSEELDSL